MTSLPATGKHVHLCCLCVCLMFVVWKEGRRKEGEEREKEGSEGGRQGRTREEGGKEKGKKEGEN